MLAFNRSILNQHIHLDFVFIKIKAAILFNRYIKVTLADILRMLGNRQANRNRLDLAHIHSADNEKYQQQENHVNHRTKHDFR